MSLVWIVAEMEMKKWSIQLLSTFRKELKKKAKPKVDMV